jgi:hypothetical protein
MTDLGLPIPPSKKRPILASNFENSLPKTQKKFDFGKQ